MSLHQKKQSLFNLVAGVCATLGIWIMDISFQSVVSEIVTDAAIPNIRSKHEKATGVHRHSAAFVCSSPVSKIHSFSHPSMDSLISETTRRLTRSAPAGRSRDRLNRKGRAIAICRAGQRNENHDEERKRVVSFGRPLLEAGYPPAVEEYHSGDFMEKPILLYLPGFDGTNVAPFLQFPELGTIFDVRGMQVDMSDRSTFEELCQDVVEYLDQESIIFVDEKNPVSHSETSIDSTKTEIKQKEGMELHERTQEGKATVAQRGVILKSRQLSIAASNRNRISRKDATLTKRGRLRPSRGAGKTSIAQEALKWKATRSMSSTSLDPKTISSTETVASKDSSDKANSAIDGIGVTGEEDGEIEQDVSRRDDNIAKGMRRRPVYLMGESFGGVLASAVTFRINQRLIQEQKNEHSKEADGLDDCPPPTFINGLTLINPATSYPRSNLAKVGPPLTTLPPLLYPLQLLVNIVPLFVDKYMFPQLMLMLQSKALPSVIDTPAREAYMGRMAFSLPQALKFMPQDTLRWRLTEWLEKGCEYLSNDNKLDSLRSVLSSQGPLIVCGECDETLPSVTEGDRLLALWSTKNEKSSDAHEIAGNMVVVEGAGHASTCGSRVDLAAEMRNHFPELQQKSSRTEMKREAQDGEEDFFGMTTRYDGKNLGMMPTLYWTKEHYRDWQNINRR